MSVWMWSVGENVWLCITPNSDYIAYAIVLKHYRGVCGVSMNRCSSLVPGDDRNADTRDTEKGACPE